VSLWVVMRERESVENVFFSFFSTSFNMLFFWKRDKKGGVCGSGDEKELEKYIEYIFFLFPAECVFILTPCNINAISTTLIVMKNIRKELIMIVAHYGDQIIVNQNTKINPNSLMQNKFFIPTLLYLFKSTRYKTRGGW